MMRVVPDRNTFIQRYDYQIGSETIPIDVDDVIHFKLRNPVDRFYGMPPLMAAAGRTDVDNYMRDFVKSFFLNAGVPAGLLSVKQKMSDDQKREVKGRWRSEFGGPRGWHELLILDNAEASFTPMTMQLGQRGLVIPDLDNISETRICMCFGVPTAIIGARVGLETSSYANLRMTQTFLWDNTLAPFYKRLSRTLTRNLRAELGSDLDRLEFDLSDVQALQEDEDLVHARMRADYAAGMIPLETVQNRIGLEESERKGTYLVPANMVPTPADSLFELPAPPPARSGNGAIPV